MNSVIIHAQDEKGKPIDVNIAYDVLDIIWNAKKGTLTLKEKQKYPPHYIKLTDLQVVDDAHMYLDPFVPCDCGQPENLCPHRPYQKEQA